MQPSFGHGSDVEKTGAGQQPAPGKGLSIKRKGCDQGARNQDDAVAVRFVRDPVDSGFLFYPLLHGTAKWCEKASCLFFVLFNYFSAEELRGSADKEGWWWYDSGKGGDKQPSHAFTCDSVD